MNTRKYTRKLIIISICIITMSLLVGFLYDYNKLGWNIDALNIKQAWNISKGNGQTIAIIDTGVSPIILKQESNRIIAPYNAIRDNDDVIDKNGHGTEVTSVISLSRYKNICGIAPESKIMPICAMDELGNTSPEILKTAIDWAVENNATIINLSLGGNVDDPEVTKSIEKAISKNIYVIAAAGDYHNPNLLFPADLPFVISVMAQNIKGERYSNSNFSDKATISAPGSDIPVVSIDDNDELFIRKASGTSIAVANISGLAALVRSENNNITQDQFVDFMKRSIDDDQFINANKLMTLVKSYQGGI